MNILIYLLSALVPLVVGAIWYNPKVFGKAWLKSSGLTEEYARGANVPVIMGLLFLFSILVSLALAQYAIHQQAIHNLFLFHADYGNDNSELGQYINNFMGTYGERHRSFGHGALHGVLAGLFFSLPFVSSGAMFERRGFKYIAIHVGYWIISCAIMGGILCQFLKV